MRPYTILYSRWFTSYEGTIWGVVAIQTNDHEPPEVPYIWKASIGIGRGSSHYANEQYVAAYGRLLPSEQAQGFFPHLDISRYRQDDCLSSVDEVGKMYP